MPARNKTTLIATAMAALLCCAGQAQADTFTVDFSGTFNQQAWGSQCFQGDASTRHQSA